MRFKLFASFLIASAATVLNIIPAYAQINLGIGQQSEEWKRRQQQHQPRPHVVQPQPRPYVAPTQPRPQYVPQPHVQRHHPQPHWGGGRPQIIPVPVPQYIDRPIYVQPEPQYYQQPRYYEEEPQYRPRRAYRKRQVCRTVWARDDYGRRYKVKRCRVRR